MARTVVYEWIDAVADRSVDAIPLLRKALQEVTTLQAMAMLREHIYRCIDYLDLKDRGLSNIRTESKGVQDQHFLLSDLLICKNYTYRVVKDHAERLGRDRLVRATQRLQQSKALFAAYMVDEYLELLCLSLDLFDGTTTIDLAEIWPTVRWRIPNADHLLFDPT